MRKTDFLKTCRKIKFLGNKIWRNAIALKSKKIQGIFGETFLGVYQSSLGNKIDFRDIMNVSPNILAKNWNFKNLRNSFVDEKALIPTTLMSSCHWKTLIPFWLWKKRPENAFLTLIVNYRKIIQKNKLRLKTTINWLFNDISCYLFIACFDWKIGVFHGFIISLNILGARKQSCR